MRKRRLIKLNICRVVPVISALVILMACMVSPVSAAGADWTIDFTDYIENLDVDGDTGIVTVALPLEYCAAEIQWSGGGVTKYGGEPVSSYLTAGVDYRVLFFLDRSHSLYLGNIPDGTAISVKVEVDNPVGDSYNTPLVYWYVTYFDESRNKLSQPITGNGRQSIDNVITAVGTIDKPDSAYACNIGLNCMQFNPLYSGTFTFILHGIELKFPVSSLFVDDYQNKQNQALIKAVQTELESQGKTLDSVLEQHQQTNEKLDQIYDPDVDTSAADKVNDDLGQVENFEQSQMDVIDQYSGELLAPFDLSAYVNSLTFVSTYISKIYMSLDDYTIVYMLPLALGLVLFICSRARGFDKPNKHNEQKSAGRDIHSGQGDPGAG